MTKVRKVTKRDGQLTRGIEYFHVKAQQIRKCCDAIKKKKAVAKSFYYFIALLPEVRPRSSAFRRLILLLRRFQISCIVAASFILNTERIKTKVTAKSQTS